jgi:hypothetical protein
LKAPLSLLSPQIFDVVTQYNIDLHLSFVPSQQNIADGPSRKLSEADAMLSEMAWSGLHLGQLDHESINLQLVSSSLRAQVTVILLLLSLNL